MDLSTNRTMASCSNSDIKPTNRSRRKKSMVWDHFTIETIGLNCMRATCNHCKKSFAYISGEKLAGTSHLKRHIALGICPMGRQNNEKKDQSNQLIPYPSTPRTNISANGSNLQRKRYRAANGVARVQFKANKNNNFGNMLAKMIIQHEYPIDMVEHTGFIDFARSLQPQFNITSVDLVQDQIMGIYRQDKQKLINLINGIPGRVNLTLDFLPSSQDVDHVLLMGHFTDHSWKLQKRVFSFQAVNSPDYIFSCIKDWNLEGKIFTITLDRSCYSNGNLRNIMSIKNPGILKGQLLIKGCYACLLRSLARDAISSVSQTVERVRHSVKYIKTSATNEERFNKLKQLLQVPTTKELTIDDLARWDTTYDMLMSACEVKQVFSCLDTSDPDYKSTPSMEDWRQVEILCTYLRIFHEAACKLTVFTSANFFFREASDIHLKLMHAAWSHDSLVSVLIKPLHERFSKYWEDNYLVLAAAAILDPRFRAELVESKFSCIYGKDAKNLVLSVRDNLRQLFPEYEMQNVVKMELPNNSNNNNNNDILLAEGDDLLNFDLDISDFMGEAQIKQELEDAYLEAPPVFHQPHHIVDDLAFQEPHVVLSELDRYLDDPVLPYMDELDVMGWWRMYGLKYPILSRLACDLLSVPFCTIVGEDVFDFRERRLDSYRSSLCPSMLEATVCAKDWIQYDSGEPRQTRISSEIITAAVKSES
ncbi:hypothetical protein CASFOL_001260 [Castilleja foliolosa]|uniref:BED-type domain-containing protein n=1 Tax=Castilleja foliolosa TaxID=1961234 RepID=A0ABD3EQY4_9LAMI